MDASDKAVDPIQNNLPQSLLDCITESQENFNYLYGLTEELDYELLHIDDRMSSQEDEVLPRDTALVSNIHPMADTKTSGSDNKEVVIDNEEISIDKEGISNDEEETAIEKDEAARRTNRILLEVHEAMMACPDLMGLVMSAFSPSSDPMVDTKRLALESSHGKISPVIETLRRSLNIGKDVDSDGKYRSAKNMVLAVKVILEGKQPEFIADYMAAIKAKTDYPLQKETLLVPQSMTRNTFKNYIEYANSEKFTRNIEFWQELLKRRREVLNQEEHMKAGAKELEEAQNNR